MIRTSGAAGLTTAAAGVESPRLIDAVATSLAVAALSLCLIITLAVLSGKVGAGMPLPA